VYPGAEKCVAQAPEMARIVGETLLAVPDGWPLREQSNALYFAAATPEQVAAYYGKILKGIPSDFDKWKAVDPCTLSPGQATAIHYQRYFAGGTAQHLYHWYRRDQNGDIGLYELAFSSSFDLNHPERRGPVTGIDITTKVYSRSAAISAPDDRQLGVPLYPGAVYDPNESSLMAPGMSMHVFLTPDSVQKVVAFYETRLGMKAAKGEPSPGRVNWFFRSYSTSFPRDLLGIEEEHEKGPAYHTRIIFHLDRSESKPF
jgi:hypothetical protein